VVQPPRTGAAGEAPSQAHEGRAGRQRRARPVQRRGPGLPSVGPRRRPGPAAVRPAAQRQVDGEDRLPADVGRSASRPGVGPTAGGHRNRWPTTGPTARLAFRSVEKRCPGMARLLGSIIAAPTPLPRRGRRAERAGRRRGCSQPIRRRTAPRPASSSRRRPISGRPALRRAAEGLQAAADRRSPPIAGSAAAGAEITADRRQARHWTTEPSTKLRLEARMVAARVSAGRRGTLPRARAKAMPRSQKWLRRHGLKLRSGLSAHFT